MRREDLRRPLQTPGLALVLHRAVAKRCPVWGPVWGDENGEVRVRLLDESEAMSSMQINHLVQSRCAL